MHATSNGNFNIFQLLWDSSAINNSTGPPRQQGQDSVQGAGEVKRYSLSRDIDVNPMGCENGAQQTQLTNQDQLALVDREGKTLLRYAAISGNITILDFLFKSGIRRASPDRLGKTVLDYACLSGSIDMVKRFLNNRGEGCDQSNPPPSWSTLHWACRYGTVEILEMLYKAGHEFSIIKTSQPSCSWSPLDVAVYYGNTNIANADGILMKHAFWESIGQSDLIKVDLRSGAMRVIRQNSHIIPASSLNIRCDGCTKVSFILI